MGFQKGHKKFGGRKRGGQNRITLSTKAALQEAFGELGGVAALVRWGKKNRTEFYKLWGKTLPSEIKNADGETFRVQVVEELVDAPHEDPSKNGQAPLPPARIP